MRSKLKCASPAVDAHSLFNHELASRSAWGAQYNFGKPRDLTWERTFASTRSLRVQNLGLLVILDQTARVRSAVYLDDKARVAALPSPIRGQLYPNLPLLETLQTAHGLFFRHNKHLWILRLRLCLTAHP